MPTVNKVPVPGIRQMTMFKYSFVNEAGEEAYEPGIAIVASTPNQSTSIYTTHANDQSGRLLATHANSISYALCERISLATPHFTPKQQRHNPGDADCSSRLIC